MLQAARGKRFNCSPCRDVHELKQCNVDVVCRHIRIHDKVKQLLHGERRHPRAPEEGVDVLDVFSQEVKSPGMIQVHRLAHVNDVQLPLQCTGVSVRRL